MRYGTVCSGIEAPSVAWEPLGWEPIWFSEIEKFPKAVLTHRYPNVPDLGDMTKVNWDEQPNVDVLIGGTPCQSFSIAGLRKGLDDPRGNLALEFLKIVDRKRPQWVVWENVPGVLSSNEGRDFGAFVGALVKLGYGFAYRILDAQYFGVPQRRRRVFLVASPGNWTGPAAVLFERESLQGNPAPSREKGEGVAGFTPGRLADYREGCGTIRANGGDLGGGSETLMVAHTLRGRGFDASEDGTGRVTPLVVALPINTQIATRGNKLGRGTGFGIGEDGNPAYTLQSAHCHAIGIGGSETGYALRANPSASGDKGDGGVNTTMVADHAIVRRLTPIECERLQGFPDGYTCIPWRNKTPESCPDGPRYKALGNSMAVPVVRWIGERIMMVENG